MRRTNLRWGRALEDGWLLSKHLRRCSEGRSAEETPVVGALQARGYQIRSQVVLKWKGWCRRRGILGRRRCWELAVVAIRGGVS